MKWIVLAIVLMAGTARAQVFRPRGKGPLLKKVELKTPEPAAKVTAEAMKPAPAVAAKAPAAAGKAKSAGSRVARDSRPDDLTPAPVKKKKTSARKKHKKGDDDDDVKVSDDDDDVKVSDD